MRKRGKQFKRYLDPLASLRSVRRQHGLDASQKGDLSMVLHAHLEALRLGAADETAFHQLAAAINVAMVLAERKIGDEHSRTIGAAQEGLLRLWQRGKTSGRWLCDGPGLVALNEAVAVYDAQMAAVSIQEAEDAMNEVIRRTRRGQVFEEQVRLMEKAA